MNRLLFLAFLAGLCPLVLSGRLGAQVVLEARSAAGLNEQTVEVTWETVTGDLYFVQVNESPGVPSWDYLAEAIVGVDDWQAKCTFFPERPEKPDNLMVRVLRVDD